jgi:GxxExxY protein
MISHKNHNKHKNRTPEQKDPVFQLCDVVRQTAFELHSFLGPGYLEKVYEAGMIHRLGKCGIRVTRQYKFDVRDEDGTVLGEYVADLYVEDMLLVELKAASRLAEVHSAQLLGYLKACRLKHGLLLNFGGGVFEARNLIF